MKSSSSDSLPPSNFSVLESEFKDIIYNIEDGDGENRPKSSVAVIRKTIKFQDGTQMYVTEHVDERVIVLAFYDWHKRNGTRILGFHNEPHKDKRYQTKTEPFHIHPPEVLHNLVRLRITVTGICIAS
jgi:Family of unknown function (DUF6516)